MVLLFLDFYRALYQNLTNLNRIFFLHSLCHSLIIEIHILFYKKIFLFNLILIQEMHIV